MDFDTFKEIVGTVKTKYPHFFELEHDKIPTMKDVIAFQEQYQISLPEKYIQFLLNFGGGYFGSAIVYSLDKTAIFPFIATTQLKWKICFSWPTMNVEIIMLSK